MKYSVALCTYNGAKYIEEQIRSILDQTHPVDEIVVCDDGSRDETLNIIEGLQTSTSINIRVYKNEDNLGVCANFQKAINLCKGDIVFLSDQDDVWNENKVKVVVDWFNEHPSKSVVFSDADLIDEEGMLATHQSLWDCVGFSAKAQKAFDEGFGIELFSVENRATGTTMAVRRDYAVNVCFLDVCNNSILHDGALAMLALGDNSLGYIHKRLTKYRCHSHQVAGLGEAILKPLSDDSRETSPLCGIWTNQILPVNLKPRIEYSALRHRMIGQRLGLFRMLKNIKYYKLYYSNQWKAFLVFDFYRWKKHVFCL